VGATRFRYTAVDRSGAEVRGVMHARDEDSVFREIAAKELTPLEIRRDRGASIRVRSERITTRDIAMLTREINALLEANIPLSRGLLSIGEHEKNERLRDVVVDIASMIEAGEKITAAFDRYRSVFGEVYIETLRSAEKTGRLAEVTGHLANMLERDVELRQHLKRAMTYPMIVISFVMIALGVIVVFVVPRFAKIFETNGVELPLTTRVVRTIGDFAIANWWVILGALFVGIVALVQTWRHEQGRCAIERLMHRVPYLGRVLTAVTTARFSTVLHISLDSGIEVIDAIEVAAMSTGRPVFQRECTRLCAEMRSGTAIEDAFNRSRAIPGFARRLLGSGKDAEELAGAGRIIARHYHRLSDHLAKNINTFIEPIITVAMAGIVLLIALSVFLPMWQMVSINQ